MFLFKKIASRLIFPVPLSLELIWMGLFLTWLRPQRQLGKWMTMSGVLILTLLSFHPVSTVLLQPLESEYPPLLIASQADGQAFSHSQHVAWIVVLSGGAVVEPAFPLVSQLSSATLMRLVEGIALYRNIPNVKIVLSGSQFETQLMFQFARTFGVSEQDLVFESRSRDTKDQARFVANIVARDKFILVTEASHMPRSMALFHKQGLSPIAAPVAHRVQRSSHYKWWSLFPSAGSLTMAERAFYEYFGLAWAMLRGQI
jgi:uncharacterized SAM-binding protein YcdF (DUF218 family)